MYKNSVETVKKYIENVLKIVGGHKNLIWKKRAINICSASAMSGNYIQVSNFEDKILNQHFFSKERKIHTFFPVMRYSLIIRLQCDFTKLQDNMFVSCRNMFRGK